MFTQIFGIEIPAPIGFILLFIGIILVVFLATWLIRRGGKRVGGMAASGRSRQPRLGVLDVLAIDGRRRLVIVRRDNVEHLVMIGGPNDIVVESGILRVPAGANAHREAPAFPAETRAAPPQPVPPSSPAAPRAPQPERAAPAQPAAAVRAPEAARQPALAPQRAVEQPPVPPMREAPRVQPAPQAAQPSAIPAAPSPRPAPPPVATPVRPAPPVAAPNSPAPSAPSPAAPPVAAPAKPAQQPIAAGPAPRAEGQRSSEIADRLAAALKRPVSPVADAPKPAPAPAAPALKADAPKADTPAAPKPAAAAPESKAEAPSVRPDARPAAAPVTAPQDDDPLASLEAEMANLLGRDMGKPKP